MSREHDHSMTAALPTEFRCIHCDMQWPDSWSGDDMGAAADVMRTAAMCPNNPGAIPFVDSGAAGHVFATRYVPCVGSCEARR